MNIIFIGGSSFASSDLVNDLNKKATVFFSSRKRYPKKKDNFYFDLNSKNKHLLKRFKKKKLVTCFSLQATFLLMKKNLLGSIVTKLIFLEQLI